MFGSQSNPEKQTSSPGLWLHTHTHPRPNAPFDGVIKNYQPEMRRIPCHTWFRFVTSWRKQSSPLIPPRNFLKYVGRYEVSHFFLRFQKRPLAWWHKAHTLWSYEYIAPPAPPAARTKGRPQRFNNRKSPKFHFPTFVVGEKRVLCCLGLGWVEKVFHKNFALKTLMAGGEWNKDERSRPTNNVLRQFCSRHVTEAHWAVCDVIAFGGGGNCIFWPGFCQDLLTGQAGRWSHYCSVFSALRWSLLRE